MRKSNLFIVSGPSGAGKGTLIKKLMDSVTDAWLSVSCTTRDPRDGEVPDVSYHFMDQEAFDTLALEDGFLEWANYTNHSYGTPRKPVEDALAAGKQAILEIDVQGAFQVKDKMPEAHMIFIEPPSLDVLHTRLVQRGTDSEEAIERRMATAVKELSEKDAYDICIVNDDLDEAFDQLIGYINQQANN